MHWSQKKLQFFSFTTRHKILSFGKKIAVTQNFYLHFFYSLDPLLSEFKVKFRGHSFAYTPNNTATGLLDQLHKRLCE